MFPVFGLKVLMMAVRFLICASEEETIEILSQNVQKIKEKSLF